MTSDLDLQPLFTPYTLRGVTLRNRFVMAPMQRFTPADLIPAREQADDYRQKAKGGIGLVITQGTTMDHWTSASPYARMFPPAHDGWKACVDAVREEGGHIFLQMLHEGAFRDGGFGPSGLSVTGEAKGQPLTKDQIDDIVATYARTAETAKAMGFSGVEIHAAHGFLIDQFFYPPSNRRTDEYGGDLEGRTRFAIEVIRAVRAAVGDDYPVGMRISQWKVGFYEARPFETVEDLAAFLPPLKAAGVDIFHASARRFWLPEFPGSDLGFAGWVKQLSGAPVIGVGSVGIDPDAAPGAVNGVARADGPGGLKELERRFKRGDFDLVAMGRAVLADPEWVNKVRDGRYADVGKTAAAA